ncbi:transcription termination/antitermination protein NusG [Parvularcula sp. IMCC14364]|uniref:transcription termination/antitermination protein NusG n=1 Tax=Parvularcula sp. IMCC14364 TaxID=3067902 RepID=UPI002741A9F6|nr:transcriptional activator RfaH [Parvularcula sp. IMCC14364]
MTVSDLSTSSKWYAVQTHPHKEELAFKNLQQQSYETFCPQIFRSIRHARQFKTVRRPLFPRYLFVSFDPSGTPWRAINSTLGVTGLVMMGEQPQAVPDGLVEQLQSQFELDGDSPPKTAQFTPGSKVEIVKGPFAGVIGQFEKMDGPTRVLVLLDMMNRKVPYWTNSSALYLHDK